MGAPGKKVVLAWLKDQDWTFTEMTDDQKLVMRKRWNVCGAATVTSKFTQPCTFTPMQNGRCKKHGGMTPKGIGHSAYEDGTDSRYVPAPLLEIYERAMRDGELLNMTKDLALMEGRLEQLFRKLGSGGSDKWWGALVTAVADLDQAMKAEDGDGMKAALHQISIVANQGQEQAEVWDEIFEVFEQRRKTSESEGKRRKSMRESVAIERVMWTFRQMGRANREAIMESTLPQGVKRKLLQDIAERFSRYTGSRTPPMGSPGEGEDITQ